MSQGDLESRLRRLEAVEAARSLMARYTVVVDAGPEPDALGELFAADAVFRNPTVIEGRDEIVAYYQRTLGDATFSRHHILNQDVTCEDEDRCLHTAAFLAMFGRGGESQVIFGNYRDLIVRSGDKWVIAEKGNEIVRVTTLAEGWGSLLG